KKLTRNAVDLRSLHKQSAIGRRHVILKARKDVLQHTELHCGGFLGESESLPREAQHISDRRHLLYSFSSGFLTSRIFGLTSFSLSGSAGGVGGCGNGMTVPSPLLSSAESISYSQSRRSPSRATTSTCSRRVWISFASQMNSTLAVSGGKLGKMP